MKFKSFKPVRYLAAALSFILLLGTAVPAAGTTFDPLSPGGSSPASETEAETTAGTDASDETTMEAVGSAAVTGYLSTGLEEMAEQGYVLPSYGNVKFASSVSFTISPWDLVPDTTAADLRQELANEPNLSADEVAANAMILDKIGEIGVICANTSLNVREAPTTEAAVVGKLYSGTGCIYGGSSSSSEEWVYISSGSISGWVMGSYVLTGAEAEAYVAEHDVRTATIVDDGVNVRAEAKGDSNIVCTLSLGDKFPVIGVDGNWVQIQLTATNNGYVYYEYITVENGMCTGVTVKRDLELQDEIDALQTARIEAARAAKKAAEEKAAATAAAKKKAAEEKAAAEAAAKKAQEKASQTSKKNSGDTDSGGWTLLGTFRVTFYCVDCNTPAGSRATYTGATAKEWYTCAVSKSQIPMGSTVKVEGLGTFVAQDTGVGKNQIDLFVDPDSCDGLYYRKVWIMN